VWHGYLASALRANQIASARWQTRIAFLRD
jgi:hypothetical protein